MSLDYEEFVSMLESYYGKYTTPEKKRIIMKYVMSKYPEDVLEELFRKIVTSHSSQYKVPPDIAMIEEVLKENVEISANRAWEEISRKANHYRDLVFSDPAAYMAFKNATGGLEAFSYRERSEVPWIRKRFLELYELYYKNPPECDNLIIRGIGGPKDPAMIGDVEKCKQIISNRGIVDNGLVKQLTAGIKTMDEEL